MKKLLLIGIMILLAFGGVSSAYADGSGWVVANPSFLTLSDKGILLDRNSGQQATLDGSQGAVQITLASVPPGTMDWRAGVQLAVAGGKSKSHLDVQVGSQNLQVPISLRRIGYLEIQIETQKHGYRFVLDGNANQYILYRDRVQVFAAKGKGDSSAATNYLEKSGNNLNLSFNGRIVKSYTENEPSTVSHATISTSPTITSGPSTEAVQPTAEQPAAEPTNSPVQSWENYDQPGTVSSGSMLDSNLGEQANPAESIDPTSISADTQIQAPPLPAPEAPQDVPVNNPPVQDNQVWIVVNTGSFVFNTDKPTEDVGGAAEAGQAIFDGVGQMHNVYTADAAAIPYVIQEDNLYQQGLIAPETHHPLNLFNGCKPSYYVTVNTHISGDFSSEATMQAAVLVITAQVTDGNGNVVYQTKITGVGSEGHTVDYYDMQAAQGINGYLQSVVGK